MAKGEKFRGGRLGTMGELKAQNKSRSEQLGREAEGMKKAREEGRNLIDKFEINNVVKFEDEDTRPPNKKRGLGRVINKDTVKGVLTVQFHGGKEILKPIFLVKVSDI